MAAIITPTSDRVNEHSPSLKKCLVLLFAASPRMCMNTPRVPRFPFGSGGGGNREWLWKACYKELFWWSNLTCYNRQIIRTMSPRFCSSTPIDILASITVISMKSLGSISQSVLDVVGLFLWLRSWSFSWSCPWPWWSKPMKYVQILTSKRCYDCITTMHKSSTEEV